MADLCELFGVSKQAYYKGNRTEYTEVITNEVVTEMVQDIRRRCPGVGTRKLQKMLDKYYNVNYGRDRLFALTDMGCFFGAGTVSRGRRSPDISSQYIQTS